MARALWFDTLETRNRDGLDFHDVAVWAILEALSEAYDTGIRSVHGADDRTDERLTGHEVDRLMELAKGNRNVFVIRITPVVSPLAN